MDENKLKFENKNDFQLLLIKPCYGEHNLSDENISKIQSIDKLNFNSETYTDDIIKIDAYEDVLCNSDIFIDIITDKLLIDKYNKDSNIEVESQVISEIPNYIYELLYIKNINKDQEPFNEIASLLNTNDDKIYGNALLMKTYIPSLSNSILIDNCILDNIKSILDSRVNTNIVIYDSEWSNKIVKGHLEDFANEFFDGNYSKCEIPFLLHNINIWYEICEGCSNTTCGKILEKPIYKCFWFTMITDNFRGNLYLDEVTKIINISNKLDFPFNAKAEWIDEETDEYGRKIIKNKYKILDLANNIFFPV